MSAPHVHHIKVACEGWGLATDGGPCGMCGACPCDGSQCPSGFRDGIPYWIVRKGAGNVPHWLLGAQKRVRRRGGRKRTEVPA